MANYPKPTEEWLTRTMDALSISRDEALAVWMDDHDIDAGRVKPFDLDPARQKAVRELTTAPRIPSENKVKRERKPDTEKRLVITELWHFFVTNAQIGAENAETVNPEREISFKIGENRYSVTLIRHRSPKK